MHRDLKPANVKITPEGKVKVLDFGLAKALTGDRSSPDQTHSPTLTAAATSAGVVIGTAAYMSPEQARGKSVDKRADIWAFGAVLYEMLAGTQGVRGRDGVGHARGGADARRGLVGASGADARLGAACFAPLSRS